LPAPTADGAVPALSTWSYFSLTKWLRGHVILAKCCEIISC
jgi:hypothetical protein